MKHIVALPIAVALVVASCGTPPEFTLQQSGMPVTLNGRSCQADLYTVAYSRLFAIGQPESVITRDRGTQFRINCGATTTSCKLNQSLEDCVATLERESSSSSNYSPPRTY